MLLVTILPFMVALDGCDVAPALAERCGHQELFVAPALPTNASTHATWMTQLRNWRDRCRDHIDYNGSIYNVPALRWVRTHQWVQPQMHPFDLFFYNRSRRSFTVDAYLGDLSARYGGIDSMLLWPSYPLLGLDDRNQFDMFDALPNGGVSALRAVVDLLHQRGVRVLLPWLPWDTFTRPDPGNRTDAARMADIIARAGADGANADSAINIAEEFYTDTVSPASTGHMGSAAAWQVENGPNASNPTALNWQVMDIGYWGGSADGNYTGGGGGDWPWAPSTDKWKWFDARRVTVVSDRWNQNKTDNLQAAFFNAAAYEAWENVWGCWNGITERDGAALRRVATMLRFFSALGFTASADWVPHTPEVLQSDRGVFASKWPVSRQTGREALWTIVNRASVDSGGAQLRLEAAEYGGADWTFFDCYHGMELVPARAQSGTITLSFTIEGGGYGCVLATTNRSAAAPGTPFATFLGEMANASVTPLRSLDPTWHFLPQLMEPTVRVTNTTELAPRGMILLPAGTFKFQTEGMEIEDRSDVQFPWEPKPTKQHQRDLQMPSFWIDARPVTCAEYNAYLATSGYVPIDAHNWLRNWNWSNELQPQLPAALARVPVTYVSYREAAAYCAFHRKRLPQTFEWQYAAQGGGGSANDTRAYPWGNADDESCRPELSRGRTIPGAEPVDKYRTARCASTFNVSDLVGNVWQMTSSFSDAHTATIVLKGGSNYFPTTNVKAKWYFRNTRDNLSHHNKAFLMDDAFERAGTVGFRCVRDVAKQPPVRW